MHHAVDHYLDAFNQELIFMLKYILKIHFEYFT